MSNIRTAAQREARYALSDPPSMDDRKVLAELWQESAPLPEGGLSSDFYEAVIAVADWGWRRAVEHFEIDALAARVTPTREQIADELRKHKLVHVSVSRKSAFCTCNSSVKAGTEANLEWFENHRADAVLALTQGLAEGESGEAYKVPLA